MDKLVRVIIAITLFEGAYCAEVIRGGLQHFQEGSMMPQNLYIGKCIYS